MTTNISVSKDQKKAWIQFLIFLVLSFYIGNKNVYSQGLTTYGVTNKATAKTIYGLKDAKGKIIVPAKYDLIEDGEGLFFVTLNNKMGVLDKKGKETIKPIYDVISGKFQDRTLVELNSSTDIVNYNTGNLIHINYKLYDYKFTKEGLVLVTENNRFGYVDKNGKVIIPVTYKKVNEFIDGVVSVFDGVHWGFIDTTGKVLGDFIYDAVLSMSGGKATVRKNREKLEITIRELKSAAKKVDLPEDKKLLDDYNLFFDEQYKKYEVIRKDFARNDNHSTSSLAGNCAFLIRYLKQQKEVFNLKSSLSETGNSFCAAILKYIESENNLVTRIKDYADGYIVQTKEVFLPLTDSMIKDLDSLEKEKDKLKKYLGL